MSTTPSTDWDAALVRTWLEHRIAAARLDHAEAQRGGRGEQDDWDKASAQFSADRVMREQFKIALQRTRHTKSWLRFATIAQPPQRSPFAGPSLP